MVRQTRLALHSDGEGGCDEFLILDHEVFSMLRRFQHGINVAKDHLAVDLIKKIGTWDPFLEAEHTLKYF
jgi:trimethylamine:corrinoid methyltransferase-like protein